MSEYSQTESNILEATAITCASIAMIGELFIITTYIMFEKMRRMAYQFVFLMSISDFVRSLGTVFGNPGDGTFLCTLQSFMTNFGAVSSFLWILTIALVMYTILFHSNLWEDPNTTRRIRIFAAINYSISFTVSFLPAVPFDAYEQLSEWCWIGSKNNTHLALRWIAYYAWLLFVFLTVCVLYTIMYFRIRKIDFKAKKEKRSNQMFERIKYYPMVLIICFTFAVIRRILQTFDNNISLPFFLVFLHVLFSSLYGLGNGIVYGLTPRVKKEWKRKIDAWKVNVFGVDIMKGANKGSDLDDIDNDVGSMSGDNEKSKTAMSTL